MFAGREYSTATVLLHGAVANRFGLGITDLKALDVLQRLGPMTAGAIARHTRLASASVTSLIDRLEEKRLVRRTRDAGDRRRVVVTPTPALEQNIAPLFQAMNRRMLQRFRSYTQSEVEVLIEFLSAGARDMYDEAAKLASSDER